MASNSIPVTACATPGFGYLILSRPYSSCFRQFGKYHAYSYLPIELADDEIDNTQLCIFLGPDSGTSEILPYLVWPGKGILGLGVALNASVASRVVTLVKDTGPFLKEAPTAIAHDLLMLGQAPCILFIQWGQTSTAVKEEALGLSLQSHALNSISSLASYLEKNGIQNGDGVYSSRLEGWYKETLETLKRYSVDEFLFDPTLLVAGVVQDVVQTLVRVNKLGVAGKNIIIPLSFIRAWYDDFTDRLKNDPTQTVKLVTISNR